MTSNRHGAGRALAKSPVRGSDLPDGPFLGKENGSEHHGPALDQRQSSSRCGTATYIDHSPDHRRRTVGVERRAAFYERTGALRDMVPNHVFQLLT